MACSMAFVGIAGGVGSRGVSIEHEFRYHENRAVVKRDDRIFGVDRYWVQLVGDVTDSGRERNFRTSRCWADAAFNELEEC